MNWKLFIRMLRDEAHARREILSHDTRAAILDDIADAAEACIEVTQERERKEIIGA